MKYEKFRTLFLISLIILNIKCPSADPKIGPDALHKDLMDIKTNTTDDNGLFMKAYYFSNTSTQKFDFKSRGIIVEPFPYNDWVKYC